MGKGVSLPRSLITAVLAAAGLALTGCGGGGSGSSGSAASPPPLSGTISGTAAKGPVNHGTVTAYALNNGAVGAEIVRATTDADGHFSLPMGSQAGPVMLQLGDGSYTDEATGTAMTMLPGDVMTAVIPDMTAGQAVSGVQVTPLTTMAQVMAQHLPGGMTGANITAANMAVSDYFSVGDVLHDLPIDAISTGSGVSGATQGSINYGMTLAAISQYADMQGMSSSSAMVTAMANDAADGVMDGRISGQSVMMAGMGMGVPLPATAGTSALATAMSTFTGSTQNHSGVALATMRALIDKLSGSSGQFSMYVGTYAGPVMLRVTTGTFRDEATGAIMRMDEDDVMTAVLSSIGSGADVQGICITPLTSMAQARAAAMNGGMTASNIAASNAAIGRYFMVDDVVTSPPVDMSVPGPGAAGTATQDQINHGAAIAAMSQQAHGLGLSTSSAVVTAMMQDASDGMMNGMVNGTQIQMGGRMGGGMMGGPGNTMSRTTGTAELAAALSDFMNSAMNRSGFTSADVNALVQKLAGSSGAL